jgi:hypothetical protein
VQEGDDSATEYMLQHAGAATMLYFLKGRFGTSHGVMTGKTGPRKSAAGHVKHGGGGGVNAAASRLPPKGRFGPKTKTPHATHHPAVFSLFPRGF